MVEFSSVEYTTDTKSSRLTGIPEDPKGAESGILHTVLGVWPFFAMVRQQSDVSVHDALEVIEA